MRVRAIGWIPAVAACALFAARAEEPDPWQTRLAASLEDPALRHARVAALVVDAERGAVLFARNPDRALIPASNQKLLTALAVLARLGPTHRFVTPFYGDTAPGATGAAGSLYVRGSGDPSLTSEDWWRVAADLRRAGLRRVDDLVLDEGVFDRVRWHPSWGSVSARAYHAPVGAVSANYGAFAVEVSPGDEPGVPARVAIDPPVSYLELRNRARTVASGQATRLAVERGAGEHGELVTVSGTVALGEPSEVFYRSVADPTLYAGAVFRMQLEALGVEVRGRVRRGAVPDGAALWLEFEGRPLAETVRLFLKYSNNVIAEALVKAMGFESAGEPGSWSSGLEAVTAELRRLGLDLDGARLVDGSGLSRANRVSPRLLVDALRVARGSFALGPEFVAGLPIASGDGTLRERAVDAAGEVRAKTGLLDGVVGLSGYARAACGRELVFSLLVNGHRAGDADAMGVVDGFAQALVEPNAACPRTASEPSPAPPAPQESARERDRS